MIEEKNESYRQQESMFGNPPNWFLDTFIGLTILFGGSAIGFLAYQLFNDGILHIVVIGALACWLTGRALRMWTDQ